MNGASHTVLVTGATGFLGQRVVEAFATRGHQVVAASRTAARHGDRFGPSVRGVFLDVTRPETLAPALEGVDTIVHCAARDGTQHLLDASTQRPVRRFVHVSSAVFYGTTGRSTMTEGMLPGHSSMPYAECKVAAEAAVKQARERHGLPTVILRPANIFGPGSTHWTERPATLIERGLMTLPSDAGRANLVYVDNVVAAVLAVAFHEAAVGDVFNVVDDSSLSWEELMSTYAEALGRGRVAVRPPWMLHALALSLEAAALVTRRPPLLTRDAVALLRFQGTYAKSKLESRLGHVAPVAFDDALERTSAYLRSRV